MEASPIPGHLHAVIVVSRIHVTITSDRPPVVLPEEQSVDGSEAGLDDGSLVPGHEVTRPLRGRGGEPALRPGGQRRLPDLIFFFVIFYYFFTSTFNLFIFSETAPGSRPKLRFCDGVWAVNIAPVNEGGDRVELLSHAGTAAATEMRKYFLLS